MPSARRAGPFLRRSTAEPDLTDDELARLDNLLAEGSPSPWTAFVEGRNHDSGSSFIMVGPQDGREDDMYVTRECSPAPASDLDLISEARTQLPRLIAEIRRRREGK